MLEHEVLGTPWAYVVDRTYSGAQRGRARKHRCSWIGLRASDDAEDAP
jgi:hypothetical protein